MILRLAIDLIPLYLGLPMLVPVASAATARTEGGSRLWPLPIAINLTSSFGEYRSGHLHAGLDIKTLGRDGIPCRAVANGHVSRLRASSNGYGKAIYLTLDDGETAVYAHLSEFAPELEEQLYREQVSAGRYRVDVWYEPDRFPVRAGDVIGYSGSTGAGAPHLHFEVRDERQHPVNPLCVGWRLEDRRRPEFRKAIWIPRSDRARVAGVPFAVEAEVRRVALGSYVATDTVSISGQVGLGAYIVDRINDASGRLAPYRVELVVDGVLLASVTMQSFSYSQAGEVELAYEMGRVRANNEHFLLLFHQPGESLGNRTFTGGGTIDADEIATMTGRRRDVYTATVRATDRSGNVSTLTLPFRVGIPAGPGPSVASAGAEVVEGYVFSSNLIAAEAGNPADVVLGSASGDWRVRAAADGLPDGVASVAVSERTIVIAGRAGRPLDVPVDALGIRLSGAANSFYSNTFLYVAPAAKNGVEPDSRTGLRHVRDAVRVGPVDAVFREKLALRFEGKAGSEDRSAVYRYDERKREWQFITTDLLADGVEAHVGTPGTYGVFADLQPPVIGKVVLQHLRSYATNERAPAIVVDVEDRGSGVDDESTEVFVNGVKAIAQWDGFANRLTVPLRDAGRSGVNDVTVIAFDNTGNVARREAQITLSSPETHKDEEVTDHDAE